MSGYQTTLTQTATAGLIHNQEMGLLDRQRQMSGFVSGSYYQQPDSLKDEAGESYYSPSAKNQQKPKGKGPRVKKGALLGLVGFGLPGLVGLGLLFSGLKAAALLNHIVDSVTDVRLGHSNRQLAKRFNHVGNVYNIANQMESNITFEGEGINERKLRRKFNNGLRKSLPAGTPSLMGRLFKITPAHAYADLLQRGYKFEVGQQKTVFGIRKGATLKKIIDPKGREISLTGSSQEKLDALRQFRQESAVDGSSRAWRNKILARRSTILLARQTGIKFFRFRNAIDKLRSGQVSEGDGLNRAISEDMLEDKKKVRQRLINKGLFANGFKIFNEQGQKSEDQLKEIDEKAKKEANQPKTTDYGNYSFQKDFDDDTPDNIDPPEDDQDSPPDDKEESEDEKNRKNRQRKVGGLKFNYPKAAGGVVTATFTVAAAAGVACVMREMANLVISLNQLRVNQMIDTSASVLTASSQLKGGELPGGVLNSLVRRFEGFHQSATYQVFYRNQAAASHIDGAGDFSKQINPSSFSGFFMNSLLKSLSIPLLNDKVCDILGSKVVNWLLSGIGIVALIAGAIFTVSTGGLGGAALFGAQALIGYIVGSIVEKQVEGEIDKAIEPIEDDLEFTASGLESILSSSEDSGPRNYALIDYGAGYMNDQIMIMNGGQPIGVEQSVNNTVSYLAENRQSWNSRGLLSNLFDLNNPYSLISKVAYTSPNKTMLSGFDQLVKIPTNIFPTVSADQQVTKEQLNSLLYPGQTHTIGFEDKYVDFEDKLIDDRGFDFASNTEIVESEMTKTGWDTAWHEQYSKCLVVPVAGFIVSQTLDSKYRDQQYIKDKDYIDIIGSGTNCQSTNAMRYKLYYQDCLHVTDIEIGGQDKSAMSSTACDYLLPDEWQHPDEEEVTDSLAGFINYNLFESISQLTMIADQTQPTSNSTVVLKDPLMASLGWQFNLWRI